MFHRKTQSGMFPAAIAAALAATVMVVVASLVEAVAGIESYL